MKAIFLDIDGVMITGSYRKLSPAYDGYQFHPTCVENLKEIMNETGASIVVSSTWRKAGFMRLKQMLEANGIKEGLVGQTPVIDYSTRGEEIRQYIEESRLDPLRTIEQFVILDDNDDMGDLRPFLVQTDWFSGLDSEAKTKAIEMLKKAEKPDL